MEPIRCNQQIVASAIRTHPEGYARDIFRGETKLATVYAGSLDDLSVRAAVIVTAFQRPGFGTVESHDVPPEFTADPNEAFNGAR